MFDPDALDPLKHIKKPNTAQRQNIGGPKLPAETQKKVDEFADFLAGIEEKYYHSDIQPFSAVAKQIKEKTTKFFENQLKLLTEARLIIQTEFEIQDKGHENNLPESSFQGFTEALSKENVEGGGEGKATSLQERMGITWAFMDRVYALATKMYKENNFTSSFALFHCLRFLNPDVFEYWFCEACSLQEKGEYDEAIDTFIKALLLQPASAITFFRLAACHYAQQDKETAALMLGFCAEAAKNDPEQTELLEKASALKSALAAPKAA